jgi:hypothetical protein
MSMLDKLWLFDSLIQRAIDRFFKTFAYLSLLWRRAGFALPEILCEETPLAGTNLPSAIVWYFKFVMVYPDCCDGLRETG